MTDKPHHGKIDEWHVYLASDARQFVIIGRFLDHERFKGRIAHTSGVVKADFTTGEIETRNSRYTLVI